MHTGEQENTDVEEKVQSPCPPLMQYYISSRCRLQLSEKNSIGDTSAVPHDNAVLRRSAETSTASPLFLPFNEMETNMVAPVFELNNTTRSCLKHGVVLVMLLACFVLAALMQQACGGNGFVFDCSCKVWVLSDADMLEDGYFHRQFVSKQKGTGCFGVF